MVTSLALSVLVIVAGILEIFKGLILIEFLECRADSWGDDFDDDFNHATERFGIFNFLLSFLQRESDCKQLPS